MYNYSYLLQIKFIFKIFHKKKTINRIDQITEVIINKGLNSYCNTPLRITRSQLSSVNNERR